jgi:hypothetical protein
MVAGAHDGRVDDWVFEARIVRQCFEHAPPHSFGAPAAEAAEDAVPLAERLGRSRQGEPVRTVQSTPSTSIQLSRPVEPFWSGRPMISGAIRAHCSSVSTTPPTTPNTASERQS